MNAYEPIGYLASLLVLATFSMRDMVPLRVVAIASNVAFIAYGALAGISPVLLLHVVLLPMNTLRLAESIRFRGRAEAASRASNHRVCSTPPLMDDAEAAVAVPVLSRIPPPARPLRRSTTTPTLQ
jgi:hypothetical protein